MHVYVGNIVLPWILLLDVWFCELLWDFTLCSEDHAEQLVKGIFMFITVSEYRHFLYNVDCGVSVDGISDYSKSQVWCYRYCTLGSLVMINYQSQNHLACQWILPPFPCSCVYQRTEKSPSLLLSLTGMKRKSSLLNCTSLNRCSGRCMHSAQTVFFSVSVAQSNNSL